MSWWHASALLLLRCIYGGLVVDGESAGDAALRFWWWIPFSPYYGCGVGFDGRGSSDSAGGCVRADGSIGAGAVIIEGGLVDTFSTISGAEGVRATVFLLCYWGQINEIPGVALLFRVADVVGNRGFLFRPSASRPVTVDFFSSSFLHVWSADARSTSTIRLGGGSGRWILRLFQCLASRGEAEGGASRTLVGGFGKPAFRRYLDERMVMGLFVFSLLPKVSFAKGWGSVCMLTVSSSI